MLKCAEEVPKRTAGGAITALATMMDGARHRSNDARARPAAPTAARAVARATAGAQARAGAEARAGRGASIVADMLNEGIGTKQLLC